MIPKSEIVDPTKPIPDEDTLEWDSSDVLSDAIPYREQNSKELWWSIFVEGNVSQDLYDEMFQWCKDNAVYQCGMRYNDGSNIWDHGEHFIIGSFRHPDDAFAFKLAWGTGA